MQGWLSRVVGRVAHALSDSRGATAIEYGLIASLIIIVIVSGVRAVGSNVFTNFYNEIAAALT